MSYIVININKDTGYAEYIAETIEDLQKIPHKENLFGCAAYCLEDKRVYIMNDKSGWEAQ